MILQLEMEGVLRRIELEPAEKPGAYRIMIDGEPYPDIDAYRLRPGVLSLRIAEKAYRCVLEESAESTAVYVRSKRSLYRVDDPRSLKSRRNRLGGSDGPKSVTAPMPGRVVRVLVRPGDEVTAHQGLVVIEAMKMQNELKAPKAGKVIDLRVGAGGTVAAGDVLAVVE